MLGNPVLEFNLATARGVIIVEVTLAGPDWFEDLGECEVRLDICECAFGVSSKLSICLFDLSEWVRAIINIMKESSTSGIVGQL